MTRRNFSRAALLAGIGAGIAASAQAAEKLPAPGFFDVIRERHSVRAYTDAPVSDAEVETMLRCAMQAPSAVNEQPWEFVVIRDKALLEQVGGINRYASFAKNAPVAILVCLNERREKEKGMGIVDIGICSENLLLSATALGLGAVFTGIYPHRERMDGFRKLCALPEYIEPIGLIVVGHPKITEHTPDDRFNPEAVHYNKW